jgi:hypothetical protein
MKNYILLCFLSMYFFSFGQLTQTVRGKIFDHETNVTLVGVKVQIFTSDSAQIYRTLTNEKGNFELKNIPVGKHELVAKYSGYGLKSVTITVNSGKETIVDLPLIEAFVEQNEVQVSARKKGETINELAMISAQQFSVEETDRYPGSRSDPARMASNFAGVQGADDSRNDIVIRGNSPLGVVWRVEGIDIPNPNHFAVSGSSGGPVSILNNKILGNSDFFMSAFPAEYGNSTSGVFDLKLRNGNNKMHELTGQFGFLGTELMAEGPLSKTGKSSYLVMGRYSTLSMFNSLGIKIGTDAVPQYADAAFKFNWQLKKGGNLSVFGIGGTSTINILISEQKEYSTEFYGEGDRDQRFGTAMGIGGITYKKTLNEKTFLSATASISQERQSSRHDYLIRSIDTTYENGQERYLISVDTSYQLMGFLFKTTRASGSLSITHKMNRRNTLKFGLNFENQFMNMRDSALAQVLVPNNFLVRWDFQGTALLAQAYAQWKWRITENMDFTAGIHGQYYSFSKSLSDPEPRLGWKLRMRKNQSISAGVGMHSQTQPLYIYSYHQFDAAGNKVLHNRNMDFSKSIHTAVAYEKFFNKSLQIKTEVYYQNLYNIPVTIAPSAFSVINMGGGFQRFFPDSLQNTGTGYNYGAELTVQKFFDKSFFFLYSASVFSSKYTGSDGIERNTSYNGNYAHNLLAGKEFAVNEKHTIGLGFKLTHAGGRRYGYVDIDESDDKKEIIFKDSLFNERQFKDYFRMDLKVSWKMNTPKMTHEIGLDLVNILNTRNLLGLAYAPDLADPTREPIAEKQQLGFLPIFYYKVDFKLKKRE